MQTQYDSVFTTLASICIRLWFARSICIPAYLLRRIFVGEPERCSWWPILSTNAIQFELSTEDMRYVDVRAPSDFWKGKRSERENCRASPLFAMKYEAGICLQFCAPRRMQQTRINVRTSEYANSDLLNGRYARKIINRIPVPNSVANHKSP